MRYFPLAVFLTVACGRIGFETQPATDADPIASVTDAARLDARPGFDAGPTFASGPFDPPVRVEELLDPALEDDDPTLTGDMLEIYFKRDSGPLTRSDVFVSSRATVADVWPTPNRVEELSSNDVDDAPEVSFDGLTIHFSSDRDGAVDVYRSTRASRGDLWSTPERVVELSSAGGDYAASTDRAGLNLVMTRFVANADLLGTSRSDTSASWGSPSLIAELNTAGYEADAVLAEDGLLIFYVSDDEVGGEGREIVSARRSTLEEPFVPDAPIGGINTLDDDEDPWLSEDLTTIFFARSTGGIRHIYTATRPLSQ